MSEQPEIRVLRGEMQPWTDLADPTRGPAKGVIWQHLLGALPLSGRIAFMGAHDLDLVQAVAGRGDVEVQWVLRSVSDAREMAEQSNAQVIAGSVDAWLAEGQECDWIIALDGLDRLMSYDSTPVSWAELWSGLRATGAQIVTTVPNPVGVHAMLDDRDPHLREGDRLWVSSVTDTTRPATVQQALELDVDVWLANGPLGAPYALRRPGLTVPSMVISRLADATRAVGDHWLADPDDQIRNLHAAGLGDLHAEALLLSTHPLADGIAACVVADGDALVCLDEDSGAFVGDGLRLESGSRTVAEMLEEFASAEDLPGIRELCKTVAHAYDDTSFTGTLNDITGIPDLEGRWPGAGDDVSSAEAFARALRLWLTRVQDVRRRHPWPEWMMLDGAWDSLLEAAGVTLQDEERHRAIEWAESRRVVPRDVRARLAQVDDLELSVSFARGHIRGLERTIRFRDQALRAATSPVETTTANEDQTGPGTRRRFGLIDRWRRRG